MVRFITVNTNDFLNKKGYNILIFKRLLYLNTFLLFSSRLIHLKHLISNFMKKINLSDDLTPGLDGLNAASDGFIPGPVGLTRVSVITLFSLLFFITHVAFERMLSTITFFPFFSFRYMCSFFVVVFCSLSSEFGFSFFCWSFSFFCWSFSFFQIHSFKCSFSLPLQTGFRILHRESSHFGAVTRNTSPLEGGGVSVGIYHHRR